MQSNNQATGGKHRSCTDETQAFSEASLFKTFNVVKVINDLYDFFLIFVPESIEAWRQRRKKTLTT